MAHRHRTWDRSARHWASAVYFFAGSGNPVAQPKGLGDVNCGYVTVHFNRISCAERGNSWVGLYPCGGLHSLGLDSAGSGHWPLAANPGAADLVQPDYGFYDLELCGVFISRLTKSVSRKFLCSDVFALRLLE